MTLNENMEYELQIVDIQNGTFPKYDPFLKGPSPTEKEEQTRFHAVLLGTKNPEKDNEPYTVTFFTRPVEYLTYKNKQGMLIKTSLYQLIRGLGFYTPGMDTLSSSDINTLALKGAFGKGKISLKTINKTFKDEKGKVHSASFVIPKMDVKDVKPPTNEDHKLVNQQIEEELFRCNVLS